MAEISDTCDSAQIGVILQRLSMRLNCLAGMSRTLENIPKLPTQSATSREFIRSLQNIDYLRQALDDLAVLTAELGSSGVRGEVDAALLLKIALKLDLAASKSVLDTHERSDLLYEASESTGEPLIF